MLENKINSVNIYKIAIDNLYPKILIILYINNLIYKNHSRYSKWRITKSSTHICNLYKSQLNAILSYCEKLLINIVRHIELILAIS